MSEGGREREGEREEEREGGREGGRERERARARARASVCVCVCVLESECVMSIAHCGAVVLASFSAYFRSLRVHLRARCPRTCPGFVAPSHLCLGIALCNHDRTPLSCDENRPFTLHALAT